MYSPSMPSTSSSTPPGPLPDGATTGVDFAPMQSPGRRRQRLHQPAAIYDAGFGLYSSEHPLAEHIFLPSSSTVINPIQQSFPPAAPYPSPMSRHNGWAHSSYTQWHPSDSSPDAQAAAASSSSALAHKVWLLECKHCRTFLTNRGMKAVLLLRPHVPLYSTDALPVNCSAYSTQPPFLNSSRLRGNERRTCECLTQTLCCHGCGSNVGYMIVFPCARCTSSISTSNRVTNGHRFVFHSPELIASERHYTPGELGILPAYNGSSSSSQNSSLSPRSFLPGTPDLGLHSPSTTPPTLTSTYSTMPPPAPESPCPVPSSEFAEPLKPGPQPLRAGDLLYWHHLTRSGEIPGATDRRSCGMNTVHFDL
ncbi:FAM72 protein-domain-containing protein [Lactarius quietus]|nr:FAM72 protein-domain-containing protein [Lactarius quietus]